MRLPYKSIVVKIGTNALLSKRNTLHKKRLKDIANQLADLHEKGIHVVLVSSGAMGCGRVLIPASSSRSPVEERQLLAAIGQVELMFAYRNAFKRRDIIVAQVLATKDDFRSRKHYLNMMQCFEIMLKENVIPIVNENDVVSVEELMFTDNDELAGLVTSMMEADALIMLTSVDGDDGHKGWKKERSHQNHSARRHNRKYRSLREIVFWAGWHANETTNRKKIILTGYGNAYRKCSDGEYSWTDSCRRRNWYPHPSKESKTIEYPAMACECHCPAARIYSSG